ncbi:MAG: smalltalk protein [Prevotellaceae bacterium]|nr:smalltalk protein [Candidatus Minthosoma caballi]
MNAKNTDWKFWAQVVLAVITALATALGVTSCVCKFL